MRISGKSGLLLHILTISAVLFGALPAVQSSEMREKMVVTVSTFADQKSRQLKLGEIARDAISDVLVKLNYFVVVERSRMDAVMEEMKFSQTSLVDEASALQFGKKLGARLVFFGNIGGSGYNIEEVTSKDLDGNEKKQKKAVATVTLNIQAVDAETNQTIFSHSVTGTATDQVEATGNAKPHTVLIPEAVINAAQNTRRNIQQAFPLSGLVIDKKVKNGKYYLYVDFGTNWGVNSGRRLYFYEKGEKVVHPITGQVLSASKGSLLVKDSVDEAFTEYCTAKVSRKEYNKIEIGIVVEAQPGN